MDDDAQFRQDVYSLKFAEFPLENDPDPFAHEHWGLHLVALWYRSRHRIPFTIIYADAVKAARFDNQGSLTAVLDSTCAMSEWAWWKPVADGQKAREAIEQTVRERLNVPVFGHSRMGHSRREVSTSARPECVVWWSDSMQLTFRNGLPEILDPEMASSDVLRLWPPLDHVNGTHEPVSEHLGQTGGTVDCMQPIKPVPNSVAEAWYMKRVKAYQNSAKPPSRDDDYEAGVEEFGCMRDGSARLSMARIKALRGKHADNTWKRKGRRKIK